MNVDDLGYNEVADALSVRIKAHKRYSNFHLEDWFAEHLAQDSGGRMLDIGCGSGNLFPTFMERLGVDGFLVGFDKGSELVIKARSQLVGVSGIVLNLDMNSVWPFLKNEFDLVVSTFAIYYADDPEGVLQQIKLVLKQRGEFILIGPSKNNATELYQFNNKVFGFSMDDKVAARTERMEKVFFPHVQKAFSQVQMQKIPCKLIFPSQQEFLRYFMATLLFEESCKNSGRQPMLNELSQIEMPSWELSKEMVVIRGRKS